MGRLIYSMSVSLDGFVETPSRSLDWVLVDEELHAFFNDEARGMSAFLYGRRMYELMVDYWADGGSRSVGDAGHDRVRPHLEGQAEDRVLQDP
ncbi:MAG: dihydrofolate reductase family protein [Candidatus Limnocylindrales bacterium]